MISDTFCKSKDNKRYSDKRNSDEKILGNGGDERNTEETGKILSKSQLSPNNIVNIADAIKTSQWSRKSHSSSTIDGRTHNGFLILPQEQQEREFIFSGFPMHESFLKKIYIHRFFLLFYFNIYFRVFLLNKDTTHYSPTLPFFFSSYAPSQHRHINILRWSFSSSSENNIRVRVSLLCSFSQTDAAAPLRASPVEMPDSTLTTT